MNGNRDPHKRLFFSCVNSEFRSYRRLLTPYLRRPTLEIKVEEDFIGTGGATLEVLDDYIKFCDGVIHLIGDATGSIPEAPAVERLLKLYPDFFTGPLKPLAPALANGAPGISYTQWEAYLAIHHDRPRFIYYPDSAAPRDPTFVADAAHKQAQEQHFARIKAIGRNCGKFADKQQFGFKILRDLVEILPRLGKVRGVEVAPTRLRRHVGKLIGRDGALDRLDAAWASKNTRVLVMHAWGGVGKTSLIAKWQAVMALKRWEGARRVFEWSFYHLGTQPESKLEYQGASSDRFFSEAFQFFGDPNPPPNDPWHRGTRLADLVAKERSLLILDGLEPLQYPPGHQGGLAGQLKDPALAALLTGLAVRPGGGLCVVTSRQSVSDLEAYFGLTVADWELERLDDLAGAALLAHLGVNGSDEKLREVSHAVRGHALTLQLMGAWLKKAHDGSVLGWREVNFEKADARVQGGHAFKVMKAYQDWLASAGENGQRQLAILRLIGLFDRPADPGCLRTLGAKPAIPGLTDTLVDLADEDWEATVSDLVELQLVARVPFVPQPVRGYPEEIAVRAVEANRTDPNFSLPDPTTYPPPATLRGKALEAHPLVRAYFAQQMRTREPESMAWRLAHRRLYEHLRNRVPYWPEGLVGLEPLYQAVAHGCQAGLYQEAFEAVYRRRIVRGEGWGGFYSMRVLGAFGAELGAVACFLTEPVVCPPEAPLTEWSHAALLGLSGYNLRGLGRLTEALDRFRESMKALVAQGDWTYAAEVAGNLSEVELTLGDINAAKEDAEKSVAYADRSGDTSRQFGKRTILADILHQSGGREGYRKAESLFREAERIQREANPHWPSLLQVRGCRYCDLLLAPAERVAWARTLRLPVSVTDPSARELRKALAGVRQRAEWALQIAKENRWLLGIALDHLTLGRAMLYTSLLSSRPDRKIARQEIEAAVDGLRTAGHLDFLPRGLLSRAWLNYVDGDKAGAESDLNLASVKSDLNEAQEIAERGPMPLYQADILLYRARLFSDRTALAQARELIDRHGYHRRDEELRDAKSAVGST